MDTGRGYNIVLVNTDQQRADTLGCYGNSIVETPHLDALAREGTTFTNAHCVHPLCMPARVNWITGQYVHAHGLWRNGVACPGGETNLAHELAGAGYDTAIIGKAHYTPFHGDPKIHPEAVQINNGVPVKECLDYWRTFQGPYYGFRHLELSLGHGDYGMHGGQYGLWIHEHHADKLPLFHVDSALDRRDTAYESFKSAVPLEIHSATWTTDRALEYFGTHRDRPFFVQIGYQEPHPPFNPPAPYCYRYRPEDMPLPVRREGEWGDDPPPHIRHYLTRAGWDKVGEDKEREILAHYYGMITLVDDCVGRLMDGLKAQGLADRTLVIFTSDHGDWMGDHRLRLKGMVHTRGLTRIPLLVRWPGVSVPGSTVPAVASQIDLASTIYDAAGVAPHYGDQGSSLRDVLAGKKAANRDYALVEHRHERYRPGGNYERNCFGGTPEADRPAAVRKTIINHLEEDIVMKTLVTDRYRFSYVPALRYGELFDLASDPDELYNLYDERSDLVKELKLRLLDVLVATTPPRGERQWDV